jgi:hypothetical protein
MNVTVLQMVGLLILGTAGCVLAHDNKGSANDESSGSTIQNDIRKQQHEDTCLMHPEYCQR